MYDLHIVYTAVKTTTINKQTQFWYKQLKTNQSSRYGLYLFQLFYTELENIKLFTNTHATHSCYYHF